VADTNNTDSLRSFRTALKAAKMVKAYVKMGEHDGVYVRVSKTAIAEGLSAMSGREYCEHDFRVDGDVLYIG